MSSALSAPPVDDPARSTRTPSVRLLVVEDEARLRRSLCEALREESYAVDEAADGTEGLFKAENTSYDTIILDVMLPEMDGWEVLRRVRLKHPTPVLMLTARDATQDRVRGLDGGADDYLVKPFELAELFARVRALIRRSAGQPESVLTVGDVFLDVRLRQASRNGTPIALTAREYGILEYLVVHRGQVISRSELFEHIFDERTDPLSNVLDVHVSSLRKKVARDLIVTRRGHGFCIE